MSRVKHLASQMGKTINHIGAHMPSAVVGIIRKRRGRAEQLKTMQKGGSSVAPLKEYDPYPLESLPGSM